MKVITEFNQYCKYKKYDQKYENSRQATIPSGALYPSGDKSVDMPIDRQECGFADFAGICL